MKDFAAAMNRAAPKEPAAPVTDADEWEYETTTGPRKMWDGYNTPPGGAGWKKDSSRGRPGEAWDRFDEHEESYWKRRKPNTPPGDVAMQAANAIHDMESCEGLDIEGAAAIIQRAIEAASPML